MLATRLLILPNRSLPLRDGIACLSELQVHVAEMIVHGGVSADPLDRLDQHAFRLGILALPVVKVVRLKASGRSRRGASFSSPCRRSRRHSSVGILLRKMRAWRK